MKSIIASVIAAAGLMVASSAMAADAPKSDMSDATKKKIAMPELASKHNCTACHAIDKRVVGPAFKSVADRYKGDAGAADRLVTKISKGGGGAWGSMPMPANDPKAEKQADMKELVRFILSL
jgi:cytochrome c